MSGFCTRLIGLFLLLCAVAGCTEIVPGILVHGPSDEQSGTRYRIVERNGALESIPGDSSGNSVAVDGQPGYRLIRVDGLVVARNNQEISRSSDEVSALLPGVLPSSVPPEYKVGPSDILMVTVWDHPELTTPNPSQGQIDNTSTGRTLLPNGLVVSSAGTIFYPYAGLMSVSGLTCAEIRQKLYDKLTRVIVDPQVDVKVSAYRAARVLVTGEVRNPGTVNLDDQPRGILDAIANTGGLTAGASRRQVVLVRGGRSYQINLAGLISGSHATVNPGLQAGDVIHVPNQTIDQVFMLGQVNRQQPVIVQQNSLSLTEALTTTGGVDRVNAKGSGILVFRLSDKAARSNTAPLPPASIYLFDLSRPEGLLLASEFQLLPRDVVYIDSTLLAKYNSIIASLLPTVNSLFYAAEIRNLTNQN